VLRLQVERHEQEKGSSIWGITFQLVSKEKEAKQRTCTVAEPEMLVLTKISVD
jgi:hypothetical protein